MPNWSSENPYQNLLANGLNENDVMVEMGDYGWYFPRLYRSALKYKHAKILHLHWLAPYIYWILSDQNGLRRSIKILLTRFDLFLVKLSGKKIVWTVHNIYSHDTKAKAIEKIVRKIIFNAADCVVVHADSAKKEVIEEYEVGANGKAKIHVVEHGNYCGYYKNTISKKEAREKLGLPSEEQVFLILGAIKPYKGIEEAIEAFKQIGPQNQKLVIAGKPQNEEIRSTIESLIDNDENILFFPKFIDDDEIQGFMNAADVCVFPFRKILTSGSVILAMSFGKAVIVPKQGCLVDLVDENGAIFFDEEQSIASVLSVANEKDLDQMGRNNSATIEKYSWDYVGHKLADLYKNTIEA